MGTIRSLLAIAVVLGAAGCAIHSPVVKNADLPPAAEIAVVAFRDCRIAGQKECEGSGPTAGSIFARVLSSSNKFRAVALPRPVAPKEPLSDAAAVEFAKTKGFPFVLNGEVDEYYDVDLSKSREDIAGVTLHILRVSDGFVVVAFSQLQHANTSLATPAELIEEMARHVAESLR
jgi:hypothetical protein